jgi:NMD protein affecting ribosome stability and mRNA decay
MICGRCLKKTDNIIKLLYKPEMMYCSECYNYYYRKDEELETIRREEYKKTYKYIYRNEINDAESFLFLTVVVLTLPFTVPYLIYLRTTGQL